MGRPVCKTNHKVSESKQDFVIPTGVVMGLRPTQGDEKRLLSSNRSLWKRRPPLCHPACPGVPWERTRISYYAALDNGRVCGFP
jgi:hypothetical protein